MAKNIFVAMATMTAVFMAAMRENAMIDFERKGGSFRRNGRGAPGAYGKGLRNQITRKNLARRANGQKMVA